MVLVRLLSMSCAHGKLLVTCFVVLLSFCHIPQAVISPSAVSNHMHAYMRVMSVLTGPVGACRT